MYKCSHGQLKQFGSSDFGRLVWINFSFALQPKMAFFADALMKKIFGNRADEYVTDPEFQSYFRELSALSGDRLSHEPDRLTEERASLQDETENLAYSNYKTFIQAANCSKEIYDDFTLIEGNVDRLLQNLPGLNEKCDQFLAEARKINTRRTGNSLALQKHAQLLEILEIPQVMDTCVRAGYYEEALELAQYATKQDRRLGHIPVIKSIATEVTRQKELLLEHLLEQLHTGLTLSQCLKVVGYCRRLNVFTEAELRTKFLLARNSWFDNMLAAIPRDDAYQHITKVMELSRTHLFDIVSHYRAAFPDDDPLLLPVGTARMGAAGSIGGDDSVAVNLPIIFQSWLFDKVEKFLDILEADLATLAKSQATVSRLDSVMAQCMYFGLSFGRVGADFRSLTVPIFANAVWNYFNNNVDNAYARLVSELESHRLLETFASRVTKAKFTSLLSAGTEAGDPTVAGTNVVQPPLSLLEFPPVAQFCNSVLSTFNDIRTCFPLTLSRRVATKLQTRIEDAARLLNELKRTFASDANAVGHIERVLLLLADDLAPYLNNCLDALFPSKQLASALGMNMAEFSQIPYIARINLDDVQTLVKGKKEDNLRHDPVDSVDSVADSSDPVD